MEYRPSLCRPPLLQGAAMLSLIIVSSIGCNMLATIGYVSGAGMTPAACDDLKGKRVAIVTVSNNSELGPSTTPRLLSHAVGRILGENVKRIEIVNQQEIDDWIDTEGWDYVDAKEVARGVGADVLLKIDLSDFSIHDGQSMFRGSCVAGLTAYDMTDEGKVLWGRPALVVEYPRELGLPVTDYAMGEAKFEHLYLNIVAHDISIHFYSFDHRDDFARDAASIGN